MIPALISSTHIVEAIRQICQDGIPPRRRSRVYCLVTEGGHLPPKYVITLAHEAATGKVLRSNRFSGGAESNDFLERLGFRIVECGCGGTVRKRGITLTTAPAKQMSRTVAAQRHSEHCPECKHRVREMLERLYGTCVANHALGWPTRPDAYEGTAIGHALVKVAAALESIRGFGIADFVRRKGLAPCDFWVPDPGFLVEFDERQHFTGPRKLALEAYADRQPLGFAARRWMDLCEKHDAKDINPPYRDEQRAWYDTLRDLVPLTRSLRPTVRLYVRDLAWCSLDPKNPDDRERFARLIREPEAPAGRPAVQIRPAARSRASTLRVAMVFPATDLKTSNGVPPGRAPARQLPVPAAGVFAGEAVDFVLFPEGYIRASDERSVESLGHLATELRATLLVGAIDSGVDSTGRDWQVLLRFDPYGAGPLRVYAKHSTADAIAFERADWEPQTMLPTFELSGQTAGATICHDSYLGLLPRHLAQNGARIWINPSFSDVTDIKWSSVLRLRAVENRVFALCTLHCGPSPRRTHPFGFSPDGNELQARKAGSGHVQPLSDCIQAPNIYMVDLDMNAAAGRLDWSGLPPANKPRTTRTGPALRPVRVALRGGQPAVLGPTGWLSIRAGCRVQTAHGPVYVGPVPEDRMLDAGACFRVIDRANRRNATPIIWNHWERLPTDSDRLALLMMGRAIECCAPVIISDREGIRELVEPASNYKIPARRDVDPSGEAIVDLRFARGLDSAFKMVSDKVPAHMKAIALDRYRSLA